GASLTNCGRAPTTLRILTQHSLRSPQIPLVPAAVRPRRAGNMQRAGYVGDMRILAVTTWLPTPGSPSTGAFVVRDAQAIAGRGHDVHLVHLVPPAQYAEGLAERDTIGGLPVTRVPMGTSNPVQIAGAGRVVRGMAGHADLVHTMAFSSLLPF